MSELRRHIMMQSGVVPKSLLFNNTPSDYTKAMVQIPMPTISVLGSISAQMKFEFLPEGDLPLEQYAFLYGNTPGRYVILNWYADGYSGNKTINIINKGTYYVNTNLPSYNVIYVCEQLLNSTIINGSPYSYWKQQGNWDANNNSIRIGFRARLRWYYTRLVVNGITYLDLIPNVVNGVAGVLNKVDGNFYTNVGSTGTPQDLIAEW